MALSKFATATRWENSIMQTKTTSGGDASEVALIYMPMYFISLSTPSSNLSTKHDGVEIGPLSTVAPLNVMRRSFLPASVTVMVQYC